LLRQTTTLSDAAAATKQYRHRAASGWLLLHLLLLRLLQLLSTAVTHRPLPQLPPASLLQLDCVLYQHSRSCRVRAAAALFSSQAC
jgi:hypothetical protein